MHEDLWDHLAKSGISKCSNTVEVDQHDEVKTVKSYFFDCLELKDGTRYSGVLITLDTHGKCDVVFAEVESNSDIDESGPNGAIERLRSKLSEALKSFIKNKIDLA